MQSSETVARVSDPAMKCAPRTESIWDLRTNFSLKLPEVLPTSAWRSSSNLNFFSGSTFCSWLGWINVNSGAGLSFCLLFKMVTIWINNLRYLRLFDHLLGHLQLFFQFACVQAICFVYPFIEFTLSLIIKFFNFVDLISIKDIFIPHLLQELKQ